MLSLLDGTVKHGTVLAGQITILTNLNHKISNFRVRIGFSVTRQAVHPPYCSVLLQAMMDDR
jgi:hypothetical protein